MHERENTPNTIDSSLEASIQNASRETLMKIARRAYEHGYTEILDMLRGEFQDRHEKEKNMDRAA